MRKISRKHLNPLMTEKDIINSQVLWGCYACVPDLDIAEMHHPVNAPVVTILHYHWDGIQRRLEDPGP